MTLGEDHPALEGSLADVAVAGEAGVGQEAKGLKAYDAVDCVVQVLGHI